MKITVEMLIRTGMIFVFCGLIMFTNAILCMSTHGRFSVALMGSIGFFVGLEIIAIAKLDEDQ